jgi:hypothetical protein
MLIYRPNLCNDAPSEGRIRRGGWSASVYRSCSSSSSPNSRLDRLLRWVADDMTNDVLLTSTDCPWAYFPNDGGMRIVTRSVQARDMLAAAYGQWLPPPPIAS